MNPVRNPSFMFYQLFNQKEKNKVFIEALELIYGNASISYF